MNDAERIQLSKMLQANNAEDQTELIRKNKHASKIYDDIVILKKLRKEYSRLYKSNYKEYEMMAINRANFLFNNYTDIFNKILKDEIDYNILASLIDMLFKIENGTLDQHEASFEVGKVLKKLYIDSALRKSDKLDKISKNNNKKSSKPIKKISWSQFKNINNLK